MEKKRWKKLGEDFIELPTLKNSSHSSLSEKNEIKIRYPTELDYNKRLEVLKKKGNALKKKFSSLNNTSKRFFSSSQTVNTQLQTLNTHSSSESSSESSLDSTLINIEEESEDDKSSKLSQKEEIKLLNDSFMEEMDQIRQDIKAFSPLPLSNQNSQTQIDQLIRNISTPKIDLSGNSPFIDNSLNEFLNNSDCYSQLFSSQDEINPANIQNDQVQDESHVVLKEIENDLDDKQIEDWLNATLVEENYNILTQSKKISMILNQSQELLDENDYYIYSPFNSSQDYLQSTRSELYSKKLSLSQGDLINLSSSSDENEDEDIKLDEEEEDLINKDFQQTQDILSITQFSDDENEKENNNSFNFSDEINNEEKNIFKNLSPILQDNDKISFMSPSLPKKRFFTYNLTNDDKDEELSNCELKTFTPKSILKKSKRNSINKSVSFFEEPKVNIYSQFSQTLSPSPDETPPLSPEEVTMYSHSKKKSIKRQDAVLEIISPNESNLLPNFDTDTLSKSSNLLIPTIYPPHPKQLKPLSSFDQLDTLNERVYYSSREDEEKYLSKPSNLQIQFEDNNITSFYNNENIVHSSNFFCAFDGGASIYDYNYLKDYNKIKFPNNRNKTTLQKVRCLFPTFSPPTFKDASEFLNKVDNIKLQNKIEVHENILSSSSATSDPSYSASSNTSSNKKQKKKEEKVAKTLTFSLELFCYPQGIHSSSVLTSAITYESIPPKSPFYNGGLYNVKSRKKDDKANNFISLLNIGTDLTPPNDNLTPDPREDPILGITWVLRDAKTSEIKRDIDFKSGILFLAYPPGINDNQKLREKYEKRNHLIQSRHKLLVELYELDISLKSFSQGQSFDQNDIQNQHNIEFLSVNSTVSLNSQLEFDEGCLRRSVIESEIVSLYKDIQEIEDSLCSEESTILKNLLSSTKTTFANLSSKKIQDNFAFGEFSSVNILPCFDEVSMMREIIRIIHHYDPDFTLSYSQHAASFNYLSHRSSVFGINFLLAISRGLGMKGSSYDGEDYEDKNSLTFPFNNNYLNNITRLLEANQNFIDMKNWNLYIIEIERKLGIISINEEKFLLRIYPKVKKFNNNNNNSNDQKDYLNESTMLDDFEFDNIQGEEENKSQYDPFPQLNNSNKDEFFQLYLDNVEVKISGRSHFIVWEIMRHELKLSHYDLSYLSAELLDQHFPSFSQSKLATFYLFNPINSSSRSLIFHYMLNFNLITFKFLDKIDFFIKIFEFSKIYNITPVEIYNRGSQLRVEATLLPLIHKYNYIFLSSKQEKVSNFMKSIEELPLIIEPDSGFYTDPVAVLDFRSLYPSIICANNICYSTIFGHLKVGKPDDSVASNHVSSETTQKLGVLNYPEVLSAINSVSIGGDNSNDHFISPCGAVFVPKSVRQGVLPEFLEDLLTARITLKASLKKTKAYLEKQRIDPNFNKPYLSPSLVETLDNKQLAVKLLANVTYGYTAAGFSGRMPMTEIADSIVSESHSLLHSSINFIQNNQEKWERERLNCYSNQNSYIFSENHLDSIKNRIKVIYGDTDSLFIHMPGYSLEEAFHLGNYIAKSISEKLPAELELCFEKVLHPALLMTKKRYGGLSFENLDQIKEYELKKNIIFDNFKHFNKRNNFSIQDNEENSKINIKLIHPPTILLKGLEVIRADQCKLVQKIQFYVLFFLFFSKDLSIVKNFLYDCYNIIVQISEGRLNDKFSSDINSFISNINSNFYTYFSSFSFYNEKNVGEVKRNFFSFININDFYFTRNVREAKKKKNEEDTEEKNNINKNVSNFLHKKRKITEEITPLGVLLEKLSEIDNLSRPPLSWRLPFLVIYGPPNSLLKNLVVSPEEFQLKNIHRINSTYYISKCVNPSLERILILCGVNLSQWYSHWPRIQPKSKRTNSSYTFLSPNLVMNKINQKNMANFITRGQCECCSNDALPMKYLCKTCLEVDQLNSLVLLNNNINKKNSVKWFYNKICQKCIGIHSNLLSVSSYSSSGTVIDSCRNFECNILLDRKMIEIDIEDLGQALTQLDETL